MCVCVCPPVCCSIVTPDLNSRQISRTYSLPGKGGTAQDVIRCVKFRWCELSTFWCCIKISMQLRFPQWRCLWCCHHGEEIAVDAMCKRDAYKSSRIVLPCAWWRNKWGTSISMLCTYSVTCIHRYWVSVSLVKECPHMFDVLPAIHLWIVIPIVLFIVARRCAHGPVSRTPQSISARHHWQSESCARFRHVVRSMLLLATLSLWAVTLPLCSNKKL